MRVDPWRAVGTGGILAGDPGHLSASGMIPRGLALVWGAPVSVSTHEAHVLWCFSPTLLQ